MPIRLVIPFTQLLLITQTKKDRFAIDDRIRMTILESIFTIILAIELELGTILVVI